MGRERATLARSLADQHGVHLDTIYRHARKHNGSSRKARADRGVRRAAPSPEAQAAFDALVIGKGLSTPRAREVMAAEGVETPSDTTLNRIRRDRGTNPSGLSSDLRPAVRFEAEYPNRLWQIDSTGSRLFFLDADGSVTFDPPLKRTKNKPGPTKPRVWCVAIVDDFSRCAWATLVPANDTQGWLTALARAMEEKDSGFPFCGVPDEIYSDNDSVVQSRRFGRILGMFDPAIKLTLALPYIGKRSKGKVERWIRTFEDSFERVHAAIDVQHLAQVIDQRHHQPTKWRSLDEANAALRDWLVAYNTRIHGTTKQAPFRRWIGGTVMRPPRVVDQAEIHGRMLMDERASKVHSDLTLHINRKKWALPRKEPFISMVNQSVQVWWSPDYPAVYADVDGLSYELYEAGAPHPYGEFRSFPLSGREKIKLDVAKAGAPRKDAAVGAPRAVPGSGAPAPVPPKESFLPARKRRAVVPRHATPKIIMRSFERALGDLIGNRTFHKPVMVHERKALCEFFRGRTEVDRDELTRWAVAWKETSWQQRVAGGGSA